MSSVTAQQMPTLRPGDQGEWVTYLQEQLVSAGYDPSGVDGVFGDGTETAVLAFQTGVGIAADGIVGTDTWAALVPANDSAPTTDAPLSRDDQATDQGEAQTTYPNIQFGDSGEYVHYLQEMLAYFSYQLSPPTDTFDDETRNALMAFQQDEGLNADGICGPLTWAAIARRDATMNQQPQQPAQPPTTPTQPSSTTPGEQTVPSWPVNDDERLAYVVDRLVQSYGCPVNGAAGIVGNLWAESQVIPSRIEGSSAETPMRACDFSGQLVDFTTEDVMNRDRSAGRGPEKAGIGLAQWTSQDRRRGLFGHVYDGQQYGPNILFSMDAQIDYLATELQTKYAQVYAAVTAPDISLDDASDEVVYGFEIPGSILENKTKLPRSDPRVQQVFERRRAAGERALRAYDNAGR